LRSNMKDGPQTKYSASLADVISLANDSYDAGIAKTPRFNPWKQRPPLAISYTLSDEAFPPLKANTKDPGATQSTTSETLDEATIQSAISTAIQTLKEQHQQELDQLRQYFEERLQTMENQVVDIGQQVVKQTYQALIQEDSPLATKADHMHLQYQINSIHGQLAHIIQLVSKPHDPPPATTELIEAPATPQRSGTKRPNSSRTPEKPDRDDDHSGEQTNLPSATSDLDEGMEGCEE
jgi:C-terminal processing protease CtpA/Prc